MSMVRAWSAPFSPEQAHWQDWILEAKAQSVSPVSKFKVGAIAVGQSGNAYLGTNLEFKGLGIAQTVHAEQWAISLAKASGETQLEALFVTELPCGHCRQFLQELGQPDLPIYVLVSGHWVEKNLASLLPEPFTLALRHSGVFVSSKAWLTCPEASGDDLLKLALFAAQGAYSPYTQSFCAVAVEVSGGRQFAASLIESAAYNPSLPPLQGVLVQLLSAGFSFDQIKRVVLLEREEAPLSWREETAIWVRLVTPHAQFLPVSATLRLL